MKGWGTGGFVMGGAHTRRSDPEQLEEVTLVLDGVFFLDGEFVGPDRMNIFEETVAEAEARMTVGRIAREGHQRGLSPAEIIAQIRTVAGPLPDHPVRNLGFRNPAAGPEEFRKAALQNLAYEFERIPRPPGSSEDQRIYGLMAWADMQIPQFRKK